MVYVWYVGDAARMPDDGARPARTMAIQLESLRDQAGQHVAEVQQLIVKDGLVGQEVAGNSTMTSHAAVLEVLSVPDDSKHTG